MPVARASSLTKPPVRAPDALSGPLRPSADELAAGIAVAPEQAREEALGRFEAHAEARAAKLRARVGWDTLTLRCDRREFALRDDDGTTLALLRDDKVTVRRGGLTTTRYREVMVTPVGTGLTHDQRAFVDRAFRNVGANRVPRFPRLVTRLGAPATGSSR